MINPDCKDGAPTQDERPRQALVALVGNPNTGKTTLFNRLTGSQARVGNYPGITVDRTTRRLLGTALQVDVLDVPGSYSLAGRSAEEQIAIDSTLGLNGNASPDLLVVVVDATNLARNLYLVMQLLEFDLPMVVALNMIDAAEADGLRLDVAGIAKTLGVPVVSVSAAKGLGLDRLRQALIEGLETSPRNAVWHFQPSEALQADLDDLEPLLGELLRVDASAATRRTMALWALMSVDEADELVGIPARLRLRVLARQRLARDAGRDIDGEVVSGRYRWLDQHIAPLVVATEQGRNWSEKLDAILLHPVVGFFVFISLMAIVFQALFSWSEPLIGLVEDLVGVTAEFARTYLPSGLFADFISNAVISGVGNVLVFLPQIILLFAFIGILEDSGYMARAAFLMDKIMNRIGLHGRAFVPMISSFACAVPAVMATRTMERKRDRFLTMMVLPLMTCSARLPVYTLVIAAFVPSTVLFGFVGLQTAVMVGLYLFGVVIALIAAAVLGRTVLKGERVPLLLELPPYRRPDIRSVGRLILSRSQVFVREAGTIILACTAVLWLLLTFPTTSLQVQALEAERDAVVKTADAETLAVWKTRITAEQQAQSYAGRLGRLLEPALAPLGFDWKIGVGLIGAFAAREVFVSTMAVVYGVGEDDEEGTGLREKLQGELRADGRPVYTPLVAFALLTFMALSCQCVSTLAAVRRETNSFRWPVFLWAYTATLAYLGALGVYQVGRLLGFA